jgi:hypothetical protein
MRKEIAALDGTDLLTVFAKLNDRQTPPDESSTSSKKISDFPLACNLLCRRVVFQRWSSTPQIENS